MASAPPLLALPGPEHYFDFAGGEFVVAGTSVRVAPEGGQGRGTGWSVWDGAVVAARHLERLAQLPGLSPFHACIELGAGTGLAGLAAATSFKVPTLLTDIPDVLPALTRNVSLNPHLEGLVRVAAFDWTQCQADVPALGPLDQRALILASDCVWVEPLVTPFVAALRAVSSSESLVVLAYKSRSKRVDDLLFGLLRESFSVQEAQQLDGEPNRGSVQVYHLKLLQPG